MVLSKGKDMVVRGLQDLNELECVEQEESEAVLGVQVIRGADVID